MDRAAGIAAAPRSGPGGESGVAWRQDCDAPRSRSAGLHDASGLTIRPIRGGDKGLELAFLRGLSRASRQQRLLSGRDLLPGELRRLTEIDPQREMALIATIRDCDGGEQQIGVARYVKDGDDSAEMAIVIADAWQRRGLGEKLLRALLDAAAGAGIGTLTGTAFSTNLGMLRLAQKLGFALRYQPGDATLMQLTRTT